MMTCPRACAVYASLLWKTGAMVDFAEVDSLAAGYHQRGGQPGLAYGIVIGGELAHAGGLGVRHVGGPPPDAGTVFRIASMTKSFTATAILALRDDGRLRLDDLAEEYVPELADWSGGGIDPLGAVGPRGGVSSCVRDLTRWVAGFAAAFPPGEVDGRHPLRRASRREMQLPQVLTGWAVPASFPGDGASSPPATYGFGLFVDEHPVLGRIVSHSGGYPGFGSNMAWHPATGTGVIALGNSTYAAMAPLAALMLEAVVRQAETSAHGPVVALGSPGPWPETLAARDAAGQLLQSWDDAAAHRLFSPNVAQDAPFEERRRRIALVRERIGEFGDDPVRPPEFDTPAHCRWWLTGERGSVQVQLVLNPERPPRVL